MMAHILKPGDPCPCCGQPIDSAKVLTRAEAEAALKKREDMK